jgi:hypothetical protein
VRGDPLLELSAANVTVPGPLPDAPLMIFSQSSFAVAVHAQPSPVVTLTVPVPPIAGRFALVGAIE